MEEEKSSKQTISVSLSTYTYQAATECIKERDQICTPPSDNVVIQYVWRIHITPLPAFRIHLKKELSECLKCGPVVI